MKDLKQLAIWGSLTLIVILALIEVSYMDEVPSGLVGGAAIFFVIILPIYIAIRMSKKEKEREQQ